MEMPKHSRGLHSALLCAIVISGAVLVADACWWRAKRQRRRQIQQARLESGIGASQQQQLVRLRQDLDPALLPTEKKEASVSDHDRELIHKQLGRPPAGLLKVAKYSSTGEPQILLVRPVHDGKPFPTMFWLSDPKLHAAISDVEKTGFIKELEEKRISNDPELQRRMRADHEAYIRDRWCLMSRPEWDSLEGDGPRQCLRERGVGGAVNFLKVRCLHMHYAFHLIRPTAVGEILDREFNVRAHT
eukprot:GDKH01001382.1.p1 GENE.GDKH01001382.1~~GDKH01001382.1.p1  ORF type:complete len:245 (+),score=26.09 GDKH01001382.1:164-898(+)